MNHIYLEIERKACYLRHDGETEEIPFKIRKGHLTDGLCVECKIKGKLEKNTLTKSTYFPLNELCQKCHDSIYFHQHITKKRIQHVVTF